MLYMNMRMNSVYEYAMLDINILKESIYELCCIRISYAVYAVVQYMLRPTGAYAA